MNAKKKIDITGMKRNEALTVLIRDGMDLADAEAYWKEHGAIKKGFRSAFYSALIERDMNKEDVSKFMDEQEASDNVKNLLNYYTGIAELVAKAVENRSE